MLLQIPHHYRHWTLRLMLNLCSLMTVCHNLPPNYTTNRCAILDLQKWHAIDNECIIMSSCIFFPRWMGRRVILYIVSVSGSVTVMYSVLEVNSCNIVEWCVLYIDACSSVLMGVGGREKKLCFRTHALVRVLVMNGQRLNNQ